MANDNVTDIEGNIFENETAMLSAGANQPETTSTNRYVVEEEENVTTKRDKRIQQ